MSSEALPARPLTAGELLDASVAVVRRAPWRLLGAATVLAAAEQAVLFPLRRSWIPGDPHRYTALLTIDGFGRLWRLIAAGMGCEAFIVAVLGALAAGPALDLLARVPRARPRPVATLLASACVGAGAAGTWLLGGVPWLFWFGLTELITPVLAGDAYRGGDAVTRIGVFRAVGRGLGLATRVGLRAGRLRLLAYAVWWLIRFFVGYLGTVLLGDVLQIGSGTARIACGYVLWTGVNALAYAAIAGLDAATHLEVRMRVEGLDLVLAAAARRGMTAAEATAVPR